MSDVQSTKVCCRCGKEKPLDEFYKWNSPKSKDGHRADCRECTRFYQSARHRNGSITDEQKQEWAARNYNRQLECRYGITAEEYARLLAEQDGKCGSLR